MQSGQPPKLTPEQQANEDAKEVLFETFLKSYRELTALLNKIPLHQSLKAKISDFFDTGFLWSKEAFMIMDLGSAAPKKPEEQKPACEENTPCA